MVSSWLRLEGHGIDDFEAVLDGPAIEVFRRKLPGSRTWEESITRDKYELAICGSSAISDLENVVWTTAKCLGIRSIVFLDHWVNYAKRFPVENGNLSLPGEVWVTDKYAGELAFKELPGAWVRYAGNPYLREMAAEVKRLETQRADSTRVLCVYGPSAENQDIISLHWLPSKENGNRFLRHRPHPSDKPSERSLAEDIAWSTMVVGYDSMALAVALKAGRRVVSVLSKKETLTIPYPGIERIHD